MVWLAIAADEWARGMIMFFRWRSRAWEGKSLVGPAAVQPGPPGSSGQPVAVMSE